jgi:hypothetical protein
MGHGVDNPLPSSAKVKERGELLDVKQIYEH